MVYSLEFYHRSGKKIKIEEIPVPENEQDESAFRIMLRLQKQIDRIETLPEPKSVYKFIS